MVLEVVVVVAVVVVVVVVVCRGGYGRGYGVRSVAVVVSGAAGAVAERGGDRPFRVVQCSRNQAECDARRRIAGDGGRGVADTGRVSQING